MFFSEHDIGRIARYAWEWNLMHGLTEQSWEHAKTVERERAEFIVMRLNELPEGVHRIRNTFLIGGDAA